MNETQYLRLSLRERLKARAPSSCGWFYPGKDPRFQRWQVIFRAPHKDATPSHAQRAFVIEEGHGLRIEPASKHLGNSRSYSPEWNANEYGETVIAHVLRLPGRRGLLPAASDPFNADCYHVDNVCPPMPTEARPRIGHQYTHDQANEDAARMACNFTERLAEDYRDDAEHQTALRDQEEALHPLEKAKAEAEASATKHQEDADNREAERAQLEHNLTMDLHPQERQQAQAEHDWIQSQRNEAQRRADAAQATAADLQDQIDNLEEPTAPNFHYFGKVKR